jgi:hypothetical protein
MDTDDYQEKGAAPVHKKGRSSYLESNNRNALLLKSAYLEHPNVKASIGSSKGGIYFTKRKNKRSKNGRSSLIMGSKRKYSLIDP